MRFPIELIYYVIPVMSLCLSVIGCGNYRPVKVLLSCFFILIYSFSLNGSDYSGYRYLYIATANGADIGSIHSEVGYYYLMKLCNGIGLNYTIFRIGLLTIATAVLFFSLSRLSNNFALSLFFISTMFVIYTISAYRQYIVMTFSLLFIHLYAKGYKRTSIVGLGVLLLFHPTAILPLLCILYYHFCYNKRSIAWIECIKNHYISFICIALVIRILFVGILKTGFVNSLLERVLSGRASAIPTFFSFGLISRLAFLFIISYMYRRANDVDISTRVLFWYYYFSMIIYVMIPLEFAMGRLMNNASIMLAILIPILYYNYDNVPNRAGMLIIKKITTAVVLLEACAIVILTNQLSSQDGYYPYLNTLRGDAPIILEEYDINYSTY